MTPKALVGHPEESSCHGKAEMGKPKGGASLEVKIRSSVLTMTSRGVEVATEYASL